MVSKSMSQTNIIHFQPIKEEVEKIGKACLDAAFKVHTNLGPGLLESVYESALLYELKKAGLFVENQKILPITYDEIQIESSLRIDLLVENCVIMELKATEKMIPLYEAQLLTYLKLSNIRLGYLINFNVLHLKTGIKRMVV
jgi:GxxExxY protein